MCCHLLVYQILHLTWQLCLWFFQHLSHSRSRCLCRCASTTRNPSKSAFSYTQSKHICSRVRIESRNTVDYCSRRCDHQYTIYIYIVFHCCYCFYCWLWRWRWLQPFCICSLFGNTVRNIDNQAVLMLFVVMNPKFFHWFLSVSFICYIALVFLLFGICCGLVVFNPWRKSLPSFTGSVGFSLGGRPRRFCVGSVVVSFVGMFVCSSSVYNMATCV